MKCTPEQLSKQAAWRAANPTHAQEYAETHRDEINARQRVRYHRLRSYQMAYHQVNREAVNEKRRAVHYGLTLAQYRSLSPVCQICGSEESLVVDHDHACCPGGPAKKCGACVRGRLCTPCNHGLGRFSDDTVRLAAAISYLKGNS